MSLKNMVKTKKIYYSGLDDNKISDDRTSRQTVVPLFAT